MSELFIGGVWIGGAGPELHSLDPATGLRVWEGHEASLAQVGAAIAAARSAFESWSELPLDQRTEIIQRFARLVHERRDDLARVISLETGKPTWEALSEVASMVGKVDLSIRAHRERTGTVEYQGSAGRSVFRHRPHGVMGVLGPYNFPCHLPNGHIVPALLAGNTVVYKPSEHTPWCGVETAKLWELSGLPPGVLNLVIGATDAGVAMVEDRGLDGLLFTGSAETGHSIHRHFGGRPETILALEMGGNNPLVVDEVDEVDAAVVIVLQSAYMTAGQRCTCARRLFVPDDAFGEKMIRRLAQAVEQLRVGSFEDPEPPFMGPVISTPAAERLIAAQAELERLGGKPLVEMRLLRAGTGLVSPALIDMTGVSGVPDEEHFGPLLQVYRVQSFDDAIEQANATRFGLAAGLISNHPGKWKTFLNRIRAGIVNWNRPLTGASSAAPFGGVGASGNHRPSAYYAADYCAYPVASLEQATLTRPESLPPGITL